MFVRTVAGAAALVALKLAMACMPSTPTTTPVVTTTPSTTTPAGTTPSTVPTTTTPAPRCCNHTPTFSGSGVIIPTGGTAPQCDPNNKFTINCTDQAFFGNASLELVLVVNFTSENPSASPPENIVARTFRVPPAPAPEIVNTFFCNVSEGVWYVTANNHDTPMYNLTCGSRFPNNTIIEGAAIG